MITKEFILAGRDIFTLQCPPGYQPSKDYVVKDHYTYRVRHKKATASNTEAWFIQLLTGPDNSNDYTYLGMLNPHTGEVQLTKASKYHPKVAPVTLLQRALARVWAGEQHLIEKAGFNLFHEGKCSRCGKKLTVPSSILSGFGEECMEILTGARVKSNPTVNALQPR